MTPAPRKLGPGKLVIASHNEGKVREIGALLGRRGIETVSAAALGLPEPDETGTTFAANALLKARAAADLSGLPALADDSGLCVEALGGDPGIFSARWAGEQRDFAAAMARIEAALAARGGDVSRAAHFVCALALCWPDGGEVEVEGRVDGHLIWPPRGANGFGYDAMFVRSGDPQSFGELRYDQKHLISHRADAFAKLEAAVF